jgi:hypothetical protein
MRTVYRNLKNSNTGEIMRSQEFTGTQIKDMPIYFYALDGSKIGENLSTQGFVEISEKTWKRLRRKLI